MRSFFITPTSDRFIARKIFSDRFITPTRDRFLSRHRTNIVSHLLTSDRFVTPTSEYFDHTHVRSLYWYHGRAQSFLSPSTGDRCIMFAHTNDRFHADYASFCMSWETCKPASLCCTSIALSSHIRKMFFVGSRLGCCRLQCERTVIR